jgi:hypothetical protein
MALGFVTWEALLTALCPFGYVQVKPQDGTPPPLKEGQKYFYVIETTAAPGTSGYFEIRNSRSIPTAGSGPCFLDDHGKTIRIPCPKI